MAEAASLLVQRLKQEQAQANPSAADRPICPLTEADLGTNPGDGRRHSDEEWDKLPVDGAEQHDHYIYGTPKRPRSP